MRSLQYHSKYEKHCIGNGDIVILISKENDNEALGISLFNLCLFDWVDSFPYLWTKNQILTFDFSERVHSVKSPYLYNIECQKHELKGKH